MKYIIAPSFPGYEYSKTSRCIEKMRQEVCFID